MEHRLWKLIICAKKQKVHVLGKVIQPQRENGSNFSKVIP